jgi:pimeloyl-ACP methyl ester carboxylesterase
MADSHGMDRFVSGGVTLAFVDVAPVEAGRDEPIVLVHGFASNHAVNWVNTSWVRTLTRDGRRVIALDNRGHGQSEKLHDPAAYHANIMAEDVKNLMDHLGIARADVMGYSMGARITAHLALAHPSRLRSALLGGLGIKLIDGVGLPPGIADAMEAPSAASLSDPTQRMFRTFAEATGSDLKAMAACIRGSRQTLDEAEVRSLRMPVLVSVGTEDHIAGRPGPLAALLPQGEVLDIPGRDHNLAVGDRTHKDGVLAFLHRRA